jgi:hypothetical protein
VQKVLGCAAYLIGYAPYFVQAFRGLIQLAPGVGDLFLPRTAVRRILFFFVVR